MTQRNSKGRIRAFLLATASLAVGGAATAQEVEGEEEEEIVVIGSHIGGVGDSGVLPVTVVNREDVDATGGLSADELLIYAPAVGDVEFADSNTGTNGARGDVTGANLRGLGSGRTLTLVNGRRIAPHPQSEAVDSVPVTFTNVNAVPANLISRIEVLRDGASALYGSDAIAGVVNLNLFSDYEGGELSARYGAGDELSYQEMSFGARTGIAFNNDRSNLTVAFGYYYRDNVNVNEYPEWYSTSDRRTILPADWLGDTQFDNGSTLSPYARFRAGTLLPDGRFQGIRVSSASGPVINYTSAYRSTILARSIAI